jgi:predicted NBD/HSP70 family sugar kinase
MPKILTLDLGTTYFKAAIFDDAGNLLHVERLAPPIQHA